MKDAPTKLKVSVNVSDADWQRMQELHNQWMVQEKQMLADQHQQQEALWQKQSHRLTEIVRKNEGVWLSQRLFYIVGSLSLLSIITIVLEIAFYVYFHWFQYASRHCKESEQDGNDGFPIHCCLYDYSSLAFISSTININLSYPASAARRRSPSRTIRPSGVRVTLNGIALKPNNSWS